jgi:ElaB/YqjD/DUF883 family membrane-anchored ribosome-binding protein
MAATSKVNASVEQANVSSGWDEARSDVSHPPAVLEIKKKPPTNIPAPDFGAEAIDLQSDLQTDLHTLEHRVRGYLARSKNECQRLAKTVSRRMQWLKQEHPGYIVATAAAAGFACGLLLRTRRSRRRLNFYE